MKTLTFYLTTTALAQALSFGAHASVAATDIAKVNAPDAAFNPELGTLMLFGAGVVGLYLARRRAQKTSQ